MTTGTATDPTDTAPGGDLPTPEQAVAAVVRDYIEGWFAGDTERVGRALHPLLVKRSIAPGDDSARLWTLSRQEMVDATAAGVGLAEAAGQDPVVSDVVVDGDVASAVVRCTSYVDLVHLLRVDGTWRILNVAWRRRA